MRCIFSNTIIDFEHQKIWSKHIVNEAKQLEKIVSKGKNRNRSFSIASKQLIDYFCSISNRKSHKNCELMIMTARLLCVLRCAVCIYKLLEIDTTVPLNTLFLCSRTVSAGAHQLLFACSRPSDRYGNCEQRKLTRVISRDRDT